MESIQEIFFETCKKIVPNTKLQDVQRFFAIGVLRTVAPKQLIRQEHFIVDEVWLIADGLFRAYMTYDNKEYTFEFFTAGFLIIDIESYVNKIPCYFLYEAMFTSSYYAWKMEDVLLFLEANPSFKPLVQAFVEKAFLKNVKRIAGLQTGSLKDRYLQLLEMYGDLIKKVPQYYLASYLGVKPQSLSRVKSSLKDAI